MDMPLFPVSTEAQTQSMTVPIPPIRIGGPRPVMSSILSTEAGPSSVGKDKGKGKMVELTEEELKKKKEEENLRMRQTMSLIRQGELSIENAMFVGKKVWTEDVIRSLAFGEVVIFERISKTSYEVKLKEGYQLDMPRTPAMFTIKVFQIPQNKQISENEYNEFLIKFYTKLSQDEERIWSLKKIIKITSVNKAEMFEGVFQNYVMGAVRSDGSEFTFSLADLPIMNPSDLIQILKIFLHVERLVFSVLISHVRSMLSFYYTKLASHDLVLAKEIKQIIVKPFVHRDGLTKYPEGKILHTPTWGVVFKSLRNRKALNGFFAIDEREMFPSEIIGGMVRRILMCSENSNAEINEVEKILN